MIDKPDAPHPSQIERLAFVRYLVNIGRAQLDLPEPIAASALSPPNGAAAKLGIPRTTLDARIRQLSIKRHTVR